MDQKFLEKIQKKVIALLLTLSDNLQTAAKDQCSETARLVGCWILDEYPEHKVQIFKGTFSNGLAHDILVIEDGKILFLVDPTIWQKFPESKDIIVESTSNMSEVISLLEKKYGGRWKVSEMMQKCDEDYQQELLSLIKSNGCEVPKVSREIIFAKIKPMEIKIVKELISVEELKIIAKNQFGDLVKSVVDVEQEIMALGGELHSDEEVLLSEKIGSKRGNMWGINIYPEKSGEDFIEFDSMINIKPHYGNRSRGVENLAMQERIKHIINKLVKC